VLRDYKSGARKNPIMNGIAKPLSRDQIKDVAAYLSSLSGPLSNETR
jgi:cytochrome c553